MAKLVWTFDISPGKDPVTGSNLSKDETDDSIENQWTDGFLTAPKKFPITIRVRSPKHAEVIDRERNIVVSEEFHEYED